jgi:hypothetical protein
MCTACKTVQPMLERQFEYLIDLDKLMTCVQQARTMLAVDEDPKWTQVNERHEEVLERAIRKAVFDLELKAVCSLMASAEVESRHNNGLEAAFDARILASIGNIMLSLQEAEGAL